MLQLGTKMLQSCSGTEVLCPGSTMLQQWWALFRTEASEAESSEISIIRWQQLLQPGTCVCPSSGNLQRWAR